VIGRPWRYLADFVPFAFLIVFYAELRGLAHVAHPLPYVWPQIHLEKALFFGHVPAVDLQHWLWPGISDPSNVDPVGPFERFILFVTRIHSVVPMTVAFFLWVTRRALFYRFAATFLVLSFSAAVTFFLYPSAPPWAAGNFGILDVYKINGNIGVGSSAPTNGGVGVYNLIHGNPFAAIPSLHGGYSFLITFFLGVLAWKAGKRWLVPLLAIYPLMQAFAVIYTGNHYVVDILIGYLYVLVAYFATLWIWRRFRLPT
jgi:membrane-associated phospholipid phosphatase